MRKANAIVEYGVLIMIVVLFLAGIHTYLKRSVEARVKHESDTIIGHGFGLEWPEQVYTIGGTDIDANHYNSPGGQKRRSSGASSWTLTYSQPIGAKIMKHKRASMHVQDSAKSPPSLDYPDLEYKDWQDQGWNI